jgi:GTPases - Sulfate adenylate transferase subunit 1
MQSRSIVVFGPAESGKSTLSGYLVWKEDKSFDLEKYDKKMMQYLGPAYSPDSKFAYIIDERREEILRMGGRKTGSTKELHVKEITINDDKNKLYILDTPGTEHRGRDNIKGISFADIGIFVIDQKALARLQPHLLSRRNFELLREILTPLNIWLKFKDKSKLIVAISKMDELDFSQENYEKAVRLIKEFIGEPSLNSLPISIIVNENRNHNVINKSERLNWYEGPTLIEMINILNSSKFESSDTEKPLFMKLYKEDKVKQVLRDENLSQGVNVKPEVTRLWRGKIFHGCISENSEIKIAPVMYKNKLVSINARVKGIYNVNCSQVVNSRTGDIVYIDVAQKRNLHLIESSCVYDINQPLKEGDVLQFEIDRKKIDSLSDSDKQRLHNISIKRELTVTWFGTHIRCKIIGKELNEERLLLTLFPSYKLLNFFIPVESNGEFTYKKFLLEFDNSVYIVFTLVELVDSENVMFTLKINNDNIVPGIKRFFKGFLFDFDVEKNELTFYKNKLAKLIQNIDNMNNFFALEDYQILTEIKVN